MTLKFKNRIAIFNTLAVGFTTALVFLVICFVVYNTAYSHLDEDILVEKEEVVSNLFWLQDSIIINKMPEWEEAEHSQVEVNPTFLQLKDTRGNIIFRSKNLPGNQMLESPNSAKKIYYNGEISNQRIRLGQFPVSNESGKLIGQLTIAVSRQESHNVLNNLIWVLLISFPIVLVVQFLTSSLAASRGIKPVHQLIASASAIDDSTIETRLNLPVRKDELYILTETINELLARIERSMIQQKQFTSDASHEIRTPLSAIRGTLEVLIRRKRTTEVYEEKITEIIQLVDRLDALLEQLLQLARVDSAKTITTTESVYLNPVVSAVRQKWEKLAAAKNISISNNLSKKTIVKGDKFYLELILDNLVSNAIKYGKLNGHVFLNWDNTLKIFSVEDDGIGISDKDLPNIFNRFYRADESRSSVVKGNGLGLSIVQKLARLQNITLEVKSREGKGSVFSLKFQN